MCVVQKYLALQAGGAGCLIDKGCLPEIRLLVLILPPCLYTPGEQVKKQLYLCHKFQAREVLRLDCGHPGGPVVYLGCKDGGFKGGHQF